MTYEHSYAATKHVLHNVLATLDAFERSPEYTIIPTRSVRDGLRPEHILVHYYPHPRIRIGPGFYAPRRSPTVEGIIRCHWAYVTSIAAQISVRLLYDTGFREGVCSVPKSYTSRAIYAPR